MSRLPDYHRILKPFIAGSEDSVVLPGSKEFLGGGCAGDVFRCRLRHPLGEEAILKTPKACMILGWKNGRNGAQNQRWVRRESRSSPGFFELYNQSFPSRVLTMRPATPSAKARLDLCHPQPDSPRQLWRLDDQGHLVAKLRANICVAVSSQGEPEQGAKLIVEQVRPGEACDPLQAWAWREVAGGAAVLASRFDEYVMDANGDDAEMRELCLLARWVSEPGLVQLRHAILGDPNISGPAIILKRLGKQLGGGTARGHDLANAEYVLRDIAEGHAALRSPAQAAQQMLHVAGFLRRMHLDGYVHNDLHSGNILRSTDSEGAHFCVIDLGLAREAGAFLRDLGPGCGAAWNITRDWRAFALHFISLLDGKARCIWRLVGTGSGHPRVRTEWAVPRFASVVARTADGSLTQKWNVNEATGEITSRSTGKALSLGGEDGRARSGAGAVWLLREGYIEDAATGQRLEMSSVEDGEVCAQRPRGGQGQRWFYDELTGEIVHPASAKVLDVGGASRLPKDVRALLKGQPDGVRPMFQQVLEALFKARVDPNEVCTLLGLLANMAAPMPIPGPRLAPRVAPRQPLAPSWGRSHAPWRGVNLGGWLLLEPGPSAGLFGNFPRNDELKAASEWELMGILRQQQALDALEEHRRTHITKEDFVQIKSLGLNAVRIPFGYWIVLGPLPNTPYHGPAMNFLDQAVDWAEEVGLEVVLDLHGCPGGESAEAPCGRLCRRKSDWNWKEWRLTDSLRTLEAVASRYRHRRCVTGIGVCNQPSREVPLARLCRFYDRAISVVRAAGMPADRVAVLLPAFQREAREVATAFTACSGGRHQNYCFDMHYYHCFNGLPGLSLGQHLQRVKKHADDIRQLPICVGEWSLAMSKRTANSRYLPLKESRALFARAQRKAYDDASHGWFFWTWKDGSGSEWDFRTALRWDESTLIASICAPQVCSPDEAGKPLDGDEPEVCEHSGAKAPTSFESNDVPQPPAVPLKRRAAQPRYIGVDTALSIALRLYRKEAELVLHEVDGQELFAQGVPAKRRRCTGKQTPALPLV